MPSKPIRKPAVDPKAESSAELTARRAQLAEEARVNPFAFIPLEEARILFWFGEKSMDALKALGAPVVAKRINPDHFKAWLWENREKVRKLT